MTKKKPDMQKMIRQDAVRSLMVQGFKRHEIAKELDASYSTVDRALREVRNKIVKDLKNNTLDKVLSEFLLSYDKVYRETWKRYRDAEDERVAITALALLNKLFESRIKILQSLGIVEKAADKVDLYMPTDYTFKIVREDVKEIE